MFRFIFELFVSPMHIAFGTYNLAQKYQLPDMYNLVQKYQIQGTHNPHKKYKKHRKRNKPDRYIRRFRFELFLAYHSEDSDILAAFSEL